MTTRRRVGWARIRLAFGSRFSREETQAVTL